MIPKAELSRFHETDLLGYNLSELVDLRSISVDRNQPLGKRVESFVNKVHNPYLFRVNDVAVKVEFVGTKPFSQVLPRCLAIGK